MRSAPPANFDAMKGKWLPIGVGLGIAVVIGAMLPGTCWNRLAALAWMVLLAPGMMAVGRALLRDHGSLKMSISIGGCAFSLATGWAALSLLLQILAVIGCWTPIVVLPALGLTCLGCAIGQSQRPSRVLTGLCRRAWLMADSSPAFSMAVVLLAITLGMSLLWACGPIWDYDSETYHLPLAALVLNHGHLVTSPGNPVLNAPGLGSLWHGVALMVGLPEAAALQMWLASLVLSLLIGDLTRHWFGQQASLWAIAIFWSGTIVTMVAATPRVEPLACLFLLAAVCILVEIFWSSRTMTTGQAVWIGIFLGLAASTKYQALYGWLVCGGWAAIRWVATPRLRNSRHLLLGCLIVIVALCVSAPWWGKNLIAFGNPIYPFAHGSDRPSPWWSTRQISGSTFEVNGPPVLTSPWERVIASFVNPEASSDPPWHLPHYAFLILLLTPFVRIPGRATELLATGLGLVWISLTQDQVHRHQYGSYPLLSIATAVVLIELGRQYRVGKAARWLVVGSLLLSALIPPRVVLLPDLFQSLCTTRGAESFRRRMLGTYPEAVAWINSSTPRDACILMCWESRTWQWQRSAIVDPGGRNWYAMSVGGRDRPELVSRFLQDQGIDYVLVHVGTMKYHLLVSGILSVELGKAFDSQEQTLRNTALIPVFEQGNIRIYAVNPAHEAHPPEPSPSE